MIGRPQQAWHHLVDQRMREPSFGNVFLYPGTEPSQIANLMLSKKKTTCCRGPDTDYIRRVKPLRDKAGKTACCCVSVENGYIQ